jgi:hypothetical protein
MRSARAKFRSQTDYGKDELKELGKAVRLINVQLNTEIGAPGGRLSVGEKKRKKKSPGAEAVDEDIGINQRRRARRAG